VPGGLVAGCLHRCRCLDRGAHAATTLALSAPTSSPWWCSGPRA
jgi:hypothetical protein